jgi:hypothetical protein
MICHNNDLNNNHHGNNRSTFKLHTGIREDGQRFRMARTHSSEFLQLCKKGKISALSGRFRADANRMLWVSLLFGGRGIRVQKGMEKLVLTGGRLWKIGKWCSAACHAHTKRELCNRFRMRRRRIWAQTPQFSPNLSVICTRSYLPLIDTKASPESALSHVSGAGGSFCGLLTLC